jgi:hypothetical protein
MTIRMKRREVEMEQGWIDVAETMPKLQFPSDWEITMMPPFSGVDVRFRVTLPSGLTKSVFFDSRCALGNCFDFYGKPIPHWEVSPVGAKAGRCEKNNITTLMEMIAYEKRD